MAAFMPDLPHENNTNDNNNNNSNDDTYDYHLAYRVSSINSIDQDSENVPLFIDNHKANFCIDTGSHNDIIPIEEYNSMNPRPMLHKSTLEFRSFGATETFTSKGFFQAPIRATPNGPTAMSEIHVVNLPGDTCCLLSKSTSTKLGLISINLPNTIKKITSSDFQTLASEYDDIFHGIGCHKQTVVSFSMNPDVKPVACPPSRVPIHLLPAIKDELDRLTNAGVVESVPIDDDIQWVSRMVPVPRKVEGSDKPGMRITIDLRNVNKGLNKVHHDSFNVEEMRYDLNGASIFAHLDMNNAFSQYGLDHDSRRLTTFRTPWGLKRLTRLVEGALPSSAIFHEALRRDLEGIPNVKNIMDNILVWGKGETQEEARQSLYRSLKTVFERFRKKGLTLHRSKCIFEAEKISFFGFIFSSAGISPDPEKITALKAATPPTTKEEVRSFLGMAGFNQQFIPSFATISEPLRRLTTKSAQFRWGPDQQNSFTAIKEALIQTALLSYFDPRKKTAMLTDASPYGLNAILAQDDGKGSLRPISYASRALNPTEQKYHQLEREALGIQFGCHRFRNFLLGAPFDLYIDPIPLKPMIDNPRREAPARIERIRLKIQGYNKNIILIPGNKHPSDYLSRHPLPFKSCSEEEKRNAADIENHVYYVSKLLPDAITTTRIRNEIPKDPFLSKVRSLIQNETNPFSLPKPEQIQLKPFLNIWHELSVGNDIVLRGERIVLPQSLIPDAITLSHSGHQGISKSKQFLRSSLWFPKMDKLVEDNIKSCLPCQAATPLTTTQPLQMSDLPPEPWQNLAADLFGPLPTGERILVLKCLRTKWPEIQIFLRNQSTNAEGVICAMEHIFSCHGIPEEILTDNGPPFNGKEFALFAKKAGFIHRKITPLHPQANGQAENFMKSLGKTIRTSIIQKRDWKKDLNIFLQSYRATPQASTGVSPAAGMFPGRRFKTCLPAPTNTTPPEQIEATFAAHQQRAKEYADTRRNAKASDLKVGDRVLVKQPKVNKFSTPFNPTPLTIISMKGSMVTASHPGGKQVTRNTAHFKKLPQSTTAPLSHNTLPPPSPAKPIKPNFSRSFIPPDMTPVQSDEMPTDVINMNDSEVMVEESDGKDSEAERNVTVTNDDKSRHNTSPEKTTENEQNRTEGRHFDSFANNPFRALFGSADESEIEVSDFDLPNDIKAAGRKSRKRKKVTPFQAGSK